MTGGIVTADVEHEVLQHALGPPEALDGALHAWRRSRWTRITRMRTNSVLGELRVPGTDEDDGDDDPERKGLVEGGRNAAD